MRKKASFNKVKIPFCCLIALLLLFAAALQVQAYEYRQIAGLIDLRSTFSDGDHDLDYLTRLAKERGFQVLFLNDHDRMVMEYGFFPWRNILRKRVGKPSVNLIGPSKYIDAVREINRRYPEMVIVHGVESAPYYYWGGDPFQEGLTAHDWERHLLVVGLENHDEYDNLPILHNGISWQFIKELLPVSAVFLLVAILGIILARWRGVYRFIGICMAIFSLVSLVDIFISSSSPFDQYHGDQKGAPYQLLIDYVQDKGGFTFWNHLEAKSGIGVKPPIRVETQPHPEMLKETRGYTGFAALYGDRVTVTEPGQQWDEVLLEYCVGKRARPVWGISTADYHKEGSSGDILGNYPTVFLVKELNRQAILSALNKGRMYAVRGNYNNRLQLVQFTVSDDDTGDRAISGDEITVAGQPLIQISVSTIDGVAQNVKGRLIRGGEVVKQFSGTTPFEIDYRDIDNIHGGMSYYRLDLQSEVGRIVANPIFVRFSGLDN